MLHKQTMLHKRNQPKATVMPSDDSAHDDATARLRADLQRIEALSMRMFHAATARKGHDPGLDGPAPELYATAARNLLQQASTDPADLIARQKAWWEGCLQQLDATRDLLAGASGPADPDPDPRFANPLWTSHPWFSLVRQQYHLNTNALRATLDSIEGLSPLDRRRLDYFTRQITDMMAPTNFLATNPDALQRAVETGGESLLRGLENLTRDLEAGEGDLQVTLADPDAFELGRDIATTPGAVVWSNSLLELIQYAPSTPKVHRTPLLIFPPWINKYYILDLKPRNSLVRWLVDQGFTVFVVSWRNPGPQDAQTGMDDYMRAGYLDTIQTVRTITGSARVNVTGYCIAGTTLALVLAAMARAGDRGVRTASFLTTLTDFSDQGEFTPFLTDDFVDGIEREARRTGMLSSRIMSRTFSFLRANDLIWQPAIRSYLMGDPPPAFDLLYWNGDGTNLPARMAIEYLRELCQRNRFMEGGWPHDDQLLRPADIRLPVFAVACETDHIAPWKASFNGLRRFASRDATFVLAQSGHIAGIINPPDKGKYGHWTADCRPADSDGPDAWLARASFTQGSWWHHWARWLAGHSGAMVTARIPGSHPDHPVQAPAPGRVVHRSRATT